ncbi:hypothetical protein Dimus_023008 [Dionaea muscipula]
MDGRPTSHAIDGEDMDEGLLLMRSTGEDMDRRPTPHAIDEETGCFVVAHDPSNINRYQIHRSLESSSDPPSRSQTRVFRSSCSTVEYVCE